MEKSNKQALKVTIMATFTPNFSVIQNIVDFRGCLYAPQRHDERNKAQLTMLHNRNMKSLPSEEGVNLVILLAPLFNLSQGHNHAYIERLHAWTMSSQAYSPAIVPLRNEGKSQRHQWIPKVHYKDKLQRTHIKHYITSVSFQRNRKAPYARSRAKKCGNKHKQES